MQKLIYSTIISLILLGCAQKATETVSKDENPPAEGFNLESSDDMAIALADQVMMAMGGRKAWDHTRYIKWNFFGSRRHLWDKYTGWARIEDQRSDLKIILNVNSEPLEGKVFKNGIEKQDSLDYFLDRGKRMWINDSYWLVMPYKLKDSGVTLSYLGTDTTMTGERAEVIRLTFDQVGVTPQNAYRVWITPQDSLVKQWAYYANASDTSAGFTRIWGDYQRKGQILLSGDRGGDRWLTEIEVLETVPEDVFQTFDSAF